MIVYVLKSKDILAIGNIKDATEGILYVFCKSSDVFKIDEVQCLLNSNLEIQFVPCQDVNEQLILLGGILDRCDKCIFVGEGFSVPAFYADKVVGGSTKPAAKRRKKKVEALEDTSDVETKVVEESPHTNEAEAKKEDVSDVVEPVESTSSVSRSRKRNASVDTSLQKAKEAMDKSSLVVHEPVVEFTDDVHKKLYDLLKVKSEDIGYSWNTDMLMSRILSLASEVETVDDLVASIRTIRDNDVLWKPVKKNGKQILTMAKKIG